MPVSTTLFCLLNPCRIHINILSASTIYQRSCSSTHHLETSPNDQNTRFQKYHQKYTHEPDLMQKYTWHKKSVWLLIQSLTLMVHKLATPNTVWLKDGAVTRPQSVVPDWFHNPHGLQEATGFRPNVVNNHSTIKQSKLGTWEANLPTTIVTKPDWFTTRRLD